MPPLPACQCCHCPPLGSQWASFLALTQAIKLAAGCHCTPGPVLGPQAGESEGLHSLSWLANAAGCQSCQWLHASIIAQGTLQSPPASLLDAVLGVCPLPHVQLDSRAATSLSSDCTLKRLRSETIALKRLCSQAIVLSSDCALPRRPLASGHASSGVSPGGSSRLRGPQGLAFLFPRRTEFNPARPGAQRDPGCPPAAAARFRTSGRFALARPSRPARPAPGEAPGPPDSDRT